MTAYYNENDPYAARWLRNLIAAGHIASGDVDERSIEDVRPDDIRGYTQCHFFAGIGVWSYALRRAGWPDDRSVWTGSCPCQPFSAAGKGAAFADERHLWPAFFHLIEECKPAVILGEQVASKDVDAWIDLVQDDMEGVGYAVGAVAFPSAGVGAPHIRDRTYWVANANYTRSQGRRAVRQRAAECIAGPRGVAGGLADSHGYGCESRSERCAAVGHGATVESNSCSIGVADTEQHDCGCKTESANHARTQADRPTDQCGGCGGASCGLVDASGQRRGARRNGDHSRNDRAQLNPNGGNDWPSPTNGLWRDADWLFCRDGKWRPVEPGTFPLAHGAPARVGRLRAYGNAINAEAARVFIESVMETSA